MSNLTRRSRDPDEAAPPPAQTGEGDLLERYDTERLLADESAAAAAAAAALEQSGKIRKRLFSGFATVILFNVVSLAFAVAILRPDVGAVLRVFAGIPVFTVVVATLCMSARLVLHALRWRAVVAAVSRRRDLSVGRFVAWGNLGLAVNYAIPGIGGELVSTALLRSHYGVHASVGLFALIYARVMALVVYGVAGIIAASMVDLTKLDVMGRSFIYIAALGLGTGGAIPVLLALFRKVPHRVVAVLRPWVTRVVPTRYAARRDALMLFLDELACVGDRCAEIFRLGPRLAFEVLAYNLSIVFMEWIAIAMYAYAVVGVVPVAPLVILQVAATFAGLVALTLPGGVALPELAIALVGPLVAGSSPTHIMAIITVMRATLTIVFTIALVSGAVTLARYAREQLLAVSTRAPDRSTGA